jgi:hypothetical protein
VVQGIFILFQRETILESGKNVLLPLEPKLLVMCERIGETLKIVNGVLSSTNRIGNKECAGHRCVALGRSGADW